jgi:hypothetical protein
MRQNLRSVILKKTSIDIITDPEMTRHNAVFKNHVLSLKKKGYGCVTHHREVDKTDLNTIITVLDESDPQPLLLLTWVVVQLHLCRRGMENSKKMKKNDLIIERKGGVEYIRLKNEETKNHKEITEDTRDGGVISRIPESQKCPVKIIKLYLEKLNLNCQQL